MTDYDTNARRNNIKTAAALKYDHQSDIAPRVVASGSGTFAENILALAEEHDIPIHTDPELVKVLSMLEVNSYIPLEVYAVVAEILSHIHKRNNKET